MDDERLAHLRPSDLRALTRLITDAVVGGTDVTEAVHAAIARRIGIRRRGPDERMGCISGLVYRSIRRITTSVARGLDRVLRRRASLTDERPTSAQRDAVVAALNGVLGDHLVATGSSLATPMALRRAGTTLSVHPHALRAQIPEPTTRPVVWIHGLCMSDLQWSREGHNHGRRLEQDLPVTSIFARYNTGLHISMNGKTLATRLERLVEAWPLPVEQLALIGHSMGGLVARSAIHYAVHEGYTWPERLGPLVCLGAPHHGAPLERGGAWIDVLLERSPYSAPLARLGQIRSDGITDLRYGYLRDADWQHPEANVVGVDTRRPVPLPNPDTTYLMAATNGSRRGDLKDRMLGDGLVPLDSALGRHPNPAMALQVPPTNQYVMYDTHHFELLHHPDAYRQIHIWMALA